LRVGGWRFNLLPQIGRSFSWFFPACLGGLYHDRIESVRPRSRCQDRDEEAAYGRGLELGLDECEDLQRQ
jgi:hypothetical protein